MAKYTKGIKLELSCYCCGQTVFENAEQKWSEIEGMYFLKDRETKVKCINCGLEDSVMNLVPRGIHFEDLID